MDANVTNGLKLAAETAEPNAPIARDWRIGVALAMLSRLKTDEADGAALLRGKGAML